MTIHCSAADTYRRYTCGQQTTAAWLHVVNACLSDCAYLAGAFEGLNVLPYGGEQLLYVLVPVCLLLHFLFLC